MCACVACVHVRVQVACGQVGAGSMWHNSLTPKITAYVACGCVASCAHEHHVRIMCHVPCVPTMCAHVRVHVRVRVPCVHVRVCHDAPSDVCGMCTWHMRACMCVCAGGMRVFIWHVTCAYVA
jgi:hypothetical protein